MSSLHQTKVQQPIDDFKIKQIKFSAHISTDLSQPPPSNHQQIINALHVLDRVKDQSDGDVPAAAALRRSTELTLG
jgi:hypothetical protein